MNRRVLLLVISSLLLPLACGEPGGPGYETLVITTTSLPNAVATTAYSETLVATGGDGSYTWSVTVGALAGLSLTTSTGIISGTPSAEGIDTFTVQVASGDGQTDTQQLTITVEGPLLQPNELCSDYPDSSIATFEDASLESAIRETLSLGAEENLTCRIVSGLTELDADSLGITSLVGIQNLTSLNELRLYYNSISDISALSALTSLTSLYLGFNSISNITALSGLTSLTDLDLTGNSISDIGPLSGLTGLTRLDLAFTSISDIGPLSGLTSLTDLSLYINSISDISALSGLTSLTELDLDDNSISDISVLSGLTSLTRLSLNNNPNLSDIQPLLDNTGLGAGDTVYLESTSVSCADVAALQAKGVTVQSDCP